MQTGEEILKAMRFAISASLQEKTATITTMLLPDLHEAAYQRYMSHHNVHKLVTLNKDCPHIISPTSWSGELPFPYKNKHDIRVIVIANKLGIEIIHKAESLKNDLESLGVFDSLALGQQLPDSTDFKVPRIYKQAAEENISENTLSPIGRRNA